MSHAITNNGLRSAAAERARRTTASTDATGPTMNFQRIKSDLLALGLLALAVFAGLSIASYDPADPPSTSVFPAPTEISNLCGPAGAQLAHVLHSSVGFGVWFLLFGLTAADFRLFRAKPITDPVVRLFGFALSLAAVCVALQLLIPGLGDGPVIGSGGYAGAVGVALVEEHFSLAGTLIICATLFLAGLILSGQIIVIRVAWLIATAPFWIVTKVAFGSRRKEETTGVEERREKTSGAADAMAETDEVESLLTQTDETTPVDEPAAETSDDEPHTTPTVRQPIKVNPPVTAVARAAALRAKLERKSAEAGSNGYEHPSLDLLEDAEDFPYELLAKKAQLAAVTLEKTFQEFGLNIRVAEIDTGPVITQFELELEAGLRLSKVTALADDLAIALRVPSVRVVAPIPGKNTVGVEVPNEKQVMVRLRELIESCPDDVEKNRIPLFIGKDVSGRALVIDMAKMPHLLIAGRTGTGKSVCLNTLITSILMTRSPDEVKMLMIDPKMVELSPYKRVPHLMHPVITDMKKAEAVLAWAVDKMEERYDLLARCGVRHLDNYNKLGKDAVIDRLGLDPEDPADELEIENVPERMPYIVIIADEMADMMMTSGKDVEGHIIRLAQKSRAVGIHLVLATQKPTVDVITGLIKSNLPARISFQVASRTDSRVVLDEMGADRLLGNGDMLFLAPGTSNLTRAQGTYVSDDEINRVIEFYGRYEPEYSTELAQLSTSSSGGGKTDSESLRNRDELYEQAIEVIIREGRGSVSLLQRALGIGYGRGARLIDYMAEDGIVGDYNGSQAREVLYTPEQWDAMKSGVEAEAVRV
jgi:S-DNA-T family DNA segregation ATPase FtsK/SpoIIIE